MKKLVVLFAFLLVAGLSFGQKISEKKLPAAVKSAFSAQYPEVKKAEWEKEKAGYEAEFVYKKQEASVVISAEGKILETEVEIPFSELPAAAADYLKKNYAGQKVKETAKITDADGKVTFEAEIKGKDLIFDSEGNLVK